MKPDFGTRVRAAFEAHGHLCVGIDPSDSELKAFGLEVSPKSLEIFSRAVLDAAVGRVGFVKPQVAFFERFGSEGFKILENICSEATGSGLLVIADAKRGDIGSTLRGYASAWLDSDSAFQVDALTLSPFLGPESLFPAIEAARVNSKGVFILAATSNPEAAHLQKATSGGESVCSAIANYVSELNKEAFGPTGLVIGATINLADYGLTADLLSKTPILAPGFGHQGAKLLNVRSIFGNATDNTICNVGRSITSGGSRELITRINEAKADLAEGMALL